MKVLWVADFSVKHNSGGAQRTDQHVKDFGRSLGHEIIEFNYDTPSDVLLGDFDMVVSGNLESLSRRADVFQFLLSHPNHVRYEHDSNSYLSQEARQALFQSTKKTLFLSNFHYQTFMQLYGDIFNNVEIVTSPIDTDKFYDKGEEREDKTLYIGFFHFFKGTQNFMREVLMNPDKQYVVAGWGSAAHENLMRGFKNVEWLGKLDYSRMPELYNKYKKLFYHPEKFEPFCRAVGEAALCGMELDCSDNIGAVHDLKTYGTDKLKEMCNDSPQRFWKVLCA